MLKHADLFATVRHAIRIALTLAVKNRHRREIV